MSKSDNVSKVVYTGSSLRDATKKLLAEIGADVKEQTQPVTVESSPTEDAWDDFLGDEEPQQEVNLRTITKRSHPFGSKPAYGDPGVLPGEASSKPSMGMGYIGDDGPGSGQALYASPKKKKRVTTRNAWNDIPVEKTYEPSRMEEVELMGAMTPSDNEEFDDVKDAIQILRSTERTIVFAIAVDKKNEDNNVMSSIRCNGGAAFGGYARDSARDSYIVQCVEFLQLGSVAFSYVMTMSNAGNWQVKVPIPEVVLEKYFNPQQKKMLAQYRERYPKADYDIHFIQLLGCH